MVVAPLCWLLTFGVAEIIAEGQLGQLVTVPRFLNTRLSELVIIWHLLDGYSVDANVLTPQRAGLGNLKDTRVNLTRCADKA
jgi:hypothetical protein